VQVSHHLHHALPQLLVCNVPPACDSTCRIAQMRVDTAHAFSTYVVREGVQRFTGWCGKGGMRNVPPARDATCEKQRQTQQHSSAQTLLCGVGWVGAGCTMTCHSCSSAMYHQLVTAPAKCATQDCLKSQAPRSLAWLLCMHHASCMAWRSGLDTPH
jgi:hypothetical protein